MRCSILGFIVALLGGPAFALSLTVPGASNPYLAGMPDGATDRCTPSFCNGNVDVAPDQSPVQVPIAVFDGQSFQFLATGGASEGPISAFPADPPDGDPGQIIQHDANSGNNGIANIIVPLNALLGVFIGPNQPDGFAEPSALNFSTATSRDYATLSPGLRQPFFIGDGLRANGEQQTVLAPQGATRLFLGPADGSGWFNNEGEILVEVTASAQVPLPATAWLLLGGIGALATAARRKAANPSAAR
ncbi:MAG: VPLPA-CTERM sorting domain-containing protein [Pikeienuella sp.]